MVYMRTPISVTIDKDILKEVDKTAKRVFDGNRSSTVNYLLRQALGIEKPTIAID